MKLSELHPDVERFLLEDCYCMNEFYSFDGFEYMLFDKDTEVVKLGECDTIIACLEKESKKNNQVLILWKKDDGKRIYDNLRFDATDNNLAIVRDHLLRDNPLGKYDFDEFISGKMQKDRDDILSRCDAVMRI